MLTSGCHAIFGLDEPVHAPQDAPADALTADERARRAYLGLQGSIAKSIELAFNGFNATSTANIPPQTAPGKAAGMLTVTGQVDQGSSANKGMRLYIGMVSYNDGAFKISDAGETSSVVYDTALDMSSQPYLVLALTGIPTGTLTGSLNVGTAQTGVYHMSGDLTGDVELDMTFDGMLMDGSSGSGVARVPGSSHVTGTAKSGGGTYVIDLTI